jgi:hypothetical protein
MTASSSSRAAAATNSAIGEQHTRKSIARTPLPTPSLLNLYEYFQPVFDQLDELNKVVDFLGEEGNDRARERKRNDCRSWKY